MTESMSLSTLLKELEESTDDLCVVCQSDNDDFSKAITNRSFNQIPDGAFSKNASQQWFPDAVCLASSVPAVQAVILFCAKHNFKVSVRSGGHSWYHSWLRHGTTPISDSTGWILLDVGDLNHIEIITNDDKSVIVEAGPGALGSDILRRLKPRNLFFPCGHCPSVPVGGFILGGGFGIGFTRFGISSESVFGMQVVLANGQVVNVTKHNDDKKKSHTRTICREKRRALLHLFRGSYSGFPAVITKYSFQTFPKPTGVVCGSCVFEATKWRLALQLARDIQHYGTCQDAMTIETTMVIGYASTQLQEMTRVEMVAFVNLHIWGDSKHKSQLLFTKYTQKYSNDTLVPIQEPQPVADINNFPNEVFQGLYPTNVRYDSQCFVADEALCEYSNKDVADILQPIADMWTKGVKPPGPFSHSLIIPWHRYKKQDACVFGFGTSLFVQSYAIVPQNDQDHKNSKERNTYADLLAASHSHLLTHPHFFTHMVEANVGQCGVKSCFTPEAYQQAMDEIHVLDPNGLFTRFHGTAGNDT